MTPRVSIRSIASARAATETHGGATMSRTVLTSIGAALLAVALGHARRRRSTAQRPQIETKKVDGTDNVYIFRNGNHQSMFVVTKDGVIATDPIAYGRPTGGQQYVDEIKKVTDKPIKYLIYSHHHFDHIAGGKAFKDAGATHHRAQERDRRSSKPLERSAHRAAGRDRSATRRSSSSAAPRSSCAISASTTRTHAGDAAAEGEDHLRRRHHPGRLVPGPRHDRLLSRSRPKTSSRR